MGMTNDDKLVHMANQIARNLAAMGRDEAMAATARHLIDFWDPRMKARIRSLAVERAGDLSPIAAAAVARLPASAG
jgi:formate dehydrogenase subunit delta